jgi:hypothetical protein
MNYLDLVKRHIIDCFSLVNLVIYSCNILDLQLFIVFIRFLVFICYISLNITLIFFLYILVFFLGTTSQASRIDLLPYFSYLLEPYYSLP